MVIGCHNQVERKKTMKSFQIEITQSKDSPNITIFCPKGRLGHDTIDKIRRAFDAIIQGEKVFVVADMSEVEFISSAVVGELMGCRTSLIEKEGDLVLAGLKMNILEIMSALDADKIFKLYKDVRSAVNLYYWEYQGHVETVALSFPSELSFVPPVRQLVRRIAEQKNYSNKDAFRIETIVDEICNNAVEHGSSIDGKEVKVSVSIDNKKIEISISNTSDPDKAEMLKKMSKYLSSPKVSFHDKRGRGLALVKMLSNDFQIDNSDVGTCVRVTKIREE